MKSKRPNSRYFLLELIINSLFFILASAVCLNLFAFGYTSSDDSRNLSKATMEAQNAAEILKATGGDLSLVADALQGSVTDNVCSVSYDENWQAGAGDAFALNVTVGTSDGMLSGDIIITDREGEVYSLNVKRFIGEEGSIE